MIVITAVVAVRMADGWWLRGPPCRCMRHNFYYAHSPLNTFSVRKYSRRRLLHAFVFYSAKEYFAIFGVTHWELESLVACHRIQCQFCLRICELRFHRQLQSEQQLRQTLCEITRNHVPPPRLLTVTAVSVLMCLMHFEYSSALRH